MADEPVTRGYEQLTFPLPKDMHRVWMWTECKSIACTLSAGHTGPHECPRPFAEGRCVWWDADHPAPGAK